MENQTTISTRPTFLSVLCILSFIGLSLSIINNLFSLIFAQVGNLLYDLMQSNFETALNDLQMSNAPAVPIVQQIFEAMLRLIEILPLFVSINLAMAIAAFAGVILMWKQKKMGFFIYTIAQAILVFVPILLLGSNLLSMIMTVTSFFFAAVFITLYAVNLKSMV
jgi:hypothetical protein